MMNDQKPDENWQHSRTKAWMIIMIIVSVSLVLCTMELFGINPNFIVIGGEPVGAIEAYQPVIEIYQPVIEAIEHYKEDHGAYPPHLEALVPTYLSQTPDIHIEGGEQLSYSPEPERPGGAPFTFYLYGHHTGLQSMHGWQFKYCPVELNYCGEISNRYYHPHRINDQWIWINRSA